MSRSVAPMPPAAPGTAAAAVTPSSPALASTATGPSAAPQTGPGLNAGTSASPSAGAAPGPITALPSIGPAPAPEAAPSITPPIPPTQPPVTQIATALIGVAAAAGTHRVTVQLAPEELGRVQISITRSTDGSAVVTVTAERPGTLALITADRSQLHAALDKAGLAREGRTLHFQLAAPADLPHLADPLSHVPAAPDSAAAHFAAAGGAPAAPGAVTAEPQTPPRDAAANTPFATSGDGASGGNSASFNQNSSQRPTASAWPNAPPGTFMEPVGPDVIARHIRLGTVDITA